MKHDSQTRSLFVAVASRTVAIALLLITLQPAAAQQSVHLTGTEHLDVSGHLRSAYLYDSSSLSVLASGEVSTVSLFDRSALSLFESGVIGELAAFDSSQVWTFGGRVAALHLEGRANIFETTVTELNAYAGGAFTVERSQFKNLSSYSAAHGSVLHSSFDAVRFYGVGSGKLSITDSSVNHLYNYGGSAADTISLTGSVIQRMELFGGTTAVDSGNLSHAEANSGMLRVRGGTVSHLTGAGDSEIQVVGGTIDSFISRGGSRTTVEGGSISSMFASEGAAVNILGYDFASSGGLTLINGQLSGSGVLAGRWRDGTSWSTNISIDDAATISLGVRRSLPVVESDVTPPDALITMPEPLPAPDPNTGSWDRSLPTVILTHGMDSSPTRWASEMKGLIEAQLSGRANVYTVDWSETAQGKGLLLIGRRALEAGDTVAKMLIAALGEGYDQPIHFIGHSMGTIVNSRVVEEIAADLRSPVQVTLLDDAELLRSVSLGGARPSMRAVPNSSNVVWIDNYVSSTGRLHDSAVNVILHRGTLLGHGYPVDWYLGTVEDPYRSIMGWGTAIERSGSISSEYGPGDYLIQRLSLLDSKYELDQVDESSAIVTSWLGASLTPYITGMDVIAGTIMKVGNVFAEAVSARSGELGTISVKMVQSSPAYLWLPIAVPDDAVAASWDFRFDGLGPDDFLTIGVNDQLVFLLERRLVEDAEWYTTGLIPVDNWTGQTVTMFIGFNNSGHFEGSTITLENLTFYAIPEPSLLASLFLLFVLNRPSSRSQTCRH